MAHTVTSLVLLFTWILSTILVLQRDANAFVPSQQHRKQQQGQQQRYQRHHSPSCARHGTRLHAMKVNIRIVGRKSGGEQWLEDAYAIYEKRLRPSTLEVETVWHKDDDALVKAVNADTARGHTVVLMDPLGQTMTSERFSESMYEWIDRGGSRLSFVIGGAEGLPPSLKYPAKGGKNSKPVLLSLSALTFTHQFARLLLMEQVYRASEIRKGSGYHK